MKTSRIIELAYAEVGITADNADMTTAMVERALDILKGLINDWAGRGIQFSFNPVLTEESQIPVFAEEAVRINLSVRLNGSLGRATAQTTAQIANSSLRNLMNRYAMPNPLNSQRSYIPADYINANNDQNLEQLIKEE